MKLQKLNACLDYAGITTSSICAVHCFAFPILSLLPVVSAAIQFNSLIELLIVSSSAVTGLTSLSISYFRIHRVLLPAFLFIAGFLLVVSGHHLENVIPEEFLTLMGGLLIVSAHLQNRKFCRVKTREMSRLAG